ncbi:glycosyltransferase family 4 protein [Phenylobacterium kunshanense]|uniref:Glycosyl transferase-like protein n=1 Tax=Phenylobacterium kunshanense TaxID=1445034 RepID=A0A328BBQ1_9CAUL|nr:glycosyltransferase family 4 protein [Phenylobacterium kunshanense]RAK64752.1 glycosyl transferase-like protein [Phenylobacterium kunshanense]
MSNAAIFLHPNGFDTSGQTLLGRHSAGESFLRGLIRHADVDRFHFWNVAGRPQAELDALVQRIEAPRQPINWIPQAGRGQLAEPGVLNVPSPAIDAEAWQRRPFGSRRYALCGITHTTATARVMQILANLLIAPVEDYDALICTSTAVRQAVEAQLDMFRSYMGREYGPRRRPELQRTTIPLGVNVEDFAPSAAHRAAWRARLDIPEDAVVALYVGRFSVKTKMNPALMAMALERAARATGKPLYWIGSGWTEPQSTAEQLHADIRALCPSVEYRQVDGRPADVRFSIWSAADFFISFPDNIQETFGLTPIEAMAAGLPCVVSDWNGYKDTVRHGLDGFRIPTLAPRPGYGGDIAYWFANEWITYDNYAAITAQNVAIDLAEAEAAIVRLIEDPELRRTLGAQAQAQARSVFDWAAIIPQYQALWAEQNARRRAAAPDPSPKDNPLRPDPYTLFAGYPTRHLQPSDLVCPIPGVDWAWAQARLNGPLAMYGRFNRPTGPELHQVFTHVLENGPTPVARLLELLPAARRNYMERALIWMARHDVLTITATA